MSTNPANIRSVMLEAVASFLAAATQIHGVERIALLGSLTTNRAEPKDVDLLVCVADDANLEALARESRRLRGRLQSHNHGADVFLADTTGHYLGRTCPWRECGPGIRASCDAIHCGRRPYLHDDLRTIELSAATVGAPPLEIWPAIVRRCELPDDVERFVAAVQARPNSGV